MSHTRRTKIVATLGPASSDDVTIRALIEAGMDVARINGSHGDHATHSQTIQLVRAAAAAAGRPVGVLFDLQGPKIRLGRFDGVRQVNAGDEFAIAVGRPAEPDEVPTDYDLLDQDVEPGSPLLIADGSLQTEVISVKKGLVVCRAHNDGVLEQRKGINLPGSAVSAPAVTNKDREDAIFAAKQGVDLIALSFVRRAADVAELKALLADHGQHVPIVSKIEKPQALDHLDAILDISWGVMVARGDLGVELPPEDVPVAQKRIIAAANRASRPVITATQMLDSMQRNPLPTRAETSDVANAVLDGTDAVMLSGETAIGRYPEESVRMMARIAVATESAELTSPRTGLHGIESIPEAVSDAACHVAEVLNARYIVVFTRTGTTGILVAERRAKTPILAFTPSETVRDRLALVWGLRPHIIPNVGTLDERVLRLDRALMQAGLAAHGDRLVLCMGAPTAPPGSTSLVMVHHVGESSPA